MFSQKQSFGFVHHASLLSHLFQNTPIIAFQIQQLNIKTKSKSSKN